MPMKRKEKMMELCICRGKCSHHDLFRDGRCYSNNCTKKCNCMCVTSPNKPVEEWEKEFRYKFVLPFGNLDRYYSAEIKEFITNLLAHQRSQIAEKVEKMIENKAIILEKDMPYSPEELMSIVIKATRVSRNQALSDCLTIIKGGKE